MIKPTMDTGSAYFSMYVTHVDGEGHFLKISGQLDQQSSLMIQRLFESARENLEKGVGAVPPAAIREGIVCAAKYKDGTYYRAKIINTTNLSTGSVGVHFIDYGNKDTISLNAIRFLDKYDPVFLQLRGQATDYYLTRIIHPSGRWDEPLVLKVQSLLCNTEYAAAIEGQTCTLPVISLQCMGTDVSTHLISNRWGIAVPVAKQEVLMMTRRESEAQGIKWARNFQNSKHVPFIVNQNLPSNSASAMRLHQNASVPFNAAIVSPPSAISQRLLVNSNALKGPVNLGGPTRQPQVTLNSLPVQTTTPPLAAPLPISLFPKKPATYKSRLLEVNSLHRVYVTNVEEGPELFSVQLVSDARRLLDMMQDLASRPYSRLAEPPMIGTICLGLISEFRLNGRAIVMNVYGSKCKICFVDYGNTEMVSYYDIFDIPEVFVKPNMFAMKFCLSGVKKLEKGPYLNEAFKQLVNEREMTLRVVAPEGPPLIQYGELYLENQNVLDLLLANVKEKLQFKWMEMLPVGSRASVLVSFVDNCIQFYVQLSDKIDDLTAVMEAVKTHCEGTSPPGELPVGTACCARFLGDGKWYRAMVVASKNKRFLVAYVDYGNEQEIDISDLRTITPDLVKLPAQAMKCALKGFEDRPVERNTSNQLEILALEKTLTADIVDLVSSDTMLVSLVDEATVPPLDIATKINQLSQPASVDTKPTTWVSKAAAAHFSSPKTARGQCYKRGKSIQDDRRQDDEGLGQRGGSSRNRDNDNSAPGWKQERQFRDNREDQGERGDMSRSNFTPRDRAERSDRFFGSDTNKRSARSFARVQYKQLAHPVPIETPFEEPTIESEAQHEVFVTSIISPKSFYCRIVSLEPKFADMMHNIPKLYNGVTPFTGDVPVGASVLARCPANGFFYRATVDSVEPFDKFIVQYVDYGSQYLVDAVDIWQLDRQLMELPRMAIHCSLIGVAPVDGLCDNTRYQCVFQECVEGQYQVSLWNNGTSDGNMAVEKQLAVLSEDESFVAFEDEAIDLTTIVGKRIPCRVTHVESHEKFYAQLDLDKVELVENTIAKFANLLTPLIQDSLIDGVHCTVKHAGKMYRAVLADASDPDNVVAVLPDYGNTITTSLANLTVLPRELSMHYYQALECCLLEHGARSAPREALRARLTGHQFIVHVQAVEGIRLMTTLYDMGTGLKVFSAEERERADTDRLRVVHCKGTPEPLMRCEPESYCAAKSSDGNWYRATIFNATDTDVAVQFPDYGHTETVAKDMLNKLDPSFSEPCARPLVVSSGLGALSDDAINKLDESTTDKQVHVTLAPGPEPATARVTTTEEPATRETVEPVRLPPGCTRVYISYIDGPGHFWLQMADKVDTIDEIQEELAAHADKYADLQERETGRLCVAKYSVDDLWYRAEVLDVDTKTTTIRFIDYGNADILNNKAGSIKVMPEKLQAIGPLAVRSSVNAAPTGTGQWSESAGDSFEALVGDTSVPVDALVILEDVTTYVDLFVGGRSVTDRLVSQGHATRAQRPTACGEPPSRHASHVNSPSETGTVEPEIPVEGDEVYSPKQVDGEKVAESLLVGDNIEIDTEEDEADDTYEDALDSSRPYLD